MSIRNEYRTNSTWRWAKKIVTSNLSIEGDSLVMNADTWLNDGSKVFNGTYLYEEPGIR